MALIKQTGSLGNHPILMATTAASGGVLLGVYVAMQIFAAPVPNSAKVPAAAPVAELKPPVKPIDKPIETTGSAPTREEAATDRCEGQTWPNLSRECSEQMQKNRPTRVVTTDRVEKPAPESPAPPPSNPVASLPAPVAPALVAPTQSAAPAAAPGVSTSTGAAPTAFAPNIAAATPQAAKPAPAPSQAAVAAVQPASPPPAAEPHTKPPTTVAVAAPVNPPDTIVANEPAATLKAAEKRKAKESRRSKKKEGENLDDDGVAFTAVDRDRESRRGARDRDLREPDDERTDRASDRAERRSLRAESRSDRSRRERAASRDADDDENTFSDRRGGRRVVVIERDSDAGERRGGLFGRSGLFGGLFGD